jgi:subtilisin family serine protease
MSLLTGRDAIVSRTALRAARRGLVFFSSAALAATLLSAPSAAAGRDAASRFRSVDGGGVTIAKSAFAPLGARGGVPMTVVVTMASDSVATARARSVNHQISDDEERSIATRTAAEHAAVRPSIEARGGHVLASYHHAINGMKIRIDSREIAGLAAMPGVVSVLKVPVYKLNNAVSVPYLGTPAVWAGVPHLRGEHIKVAIIDTGLDYTHANFGGPGTPAAYTAAHAASTQPADPSLFGPNAPKVKGGIDLVGDDYDANNPNSVPVPDSNPLDCNGHGSHVGGTVAGFGVVKGGTTFTGPYDATTPKQDFAIGPGVAPKADLYAVRVFGCTGSTNVVVDALDWAVKNGMDVVNMSLGSEYGSGDSADSVAADNASKAGVLVIASAGNSGPAPYITGAPAAATRAISVAAMDATETFTGAHLALSPSGALDALDANDAPIAGSFPIYVLRNPDNTVSLGCNEAEYVDALIAGKLVVTKRGVCARVDRATFGQKHGAGAVALINNGSGYGIHEGTIPGVTIPFLAVSIPDGAVLAAATSAILTPATVANPTFGMAASFSSGGPRIGDSFFKPNVSAPGVAIFSTAVGTGNGGEYESGTSMAAPHVAGVAALARQAHPTWSEREVAAALVQTSDPIKLFDYAPRIEGAGVVQPIGVTRTQVVSLDDKGNSALSFGFAEFSRDFHGTREMKLVNHGGTSARFTLTSTPAGGQPHTVHFNRTSISVGAGESEDFSVTLDVPGATVGAAEDGYLEVAGYVTLTPVAGANRGVALTIPYYLVPRVRANVSAELQGDLRPGRTANVRLKNAAPVQTGNADFYAWGLSSPPQGLTVNTRAVGVQSFPISATTNLLVFAINTFERFSTPATGEWDILIDSTGDGVPDYDVFSVDGSVLGLASGTAVVGVQNLTTGKIVIRYFTDAPTDGSTLLLPVRSSDIGLSAANPRLSYQVEAFDILTGAAEIIPGVAKFNAFASSITTGDYVTLPAGASGASAVSIDATEWQKTPALGVMVVVEDNAAGSSEARLLRAGR